MDLFNLGECALLIKGIGRQLILTHRKSYPQAHNKIAKIRGDRCYILPQNGGKRLKCRGILIVMDRGRPHLSGFN